MSVKLTQTFIKTSDQDWSGVFLNISTARSPITDTRDSSSLPNDTKLVLKQEKTFLEFSDGYEGWDREYIGNDKLIIYYYFDTFDNALNYFTERRKSSNTVSSKLVVQYNTNWSIDNNGTITELKPNS